MFVLQIQIPVARPSDIIIQMERFTTITMFVVRSITTVAAQDTTATVAAQDTTTREHAEIHGTTGIIKDANL